MFQSLGRRFLENPLIGKELATGLTSPRLGAVFTFVGVVYLATDLLCYLTFFLWGSSSPLEIQAGGFLHVWHSVVAYGVLGLLLPLRLSGHIEGARAGRAFDQVVVTGVSPVRMCLGNWALGLCYAATLLFATLPYEAMAYVFGGVTMAQIIACYAMLFAFSNVMIALTMGMAVVSSEWLAAPLAVFVLAVVGIVSFTPYMPAAIGEVGPLRFVLRQSLETGFVTGIPGFADALAAAPRFFFLEVPLVIYTTLLWMCLMAPFVILIVLGPRHFFLPGFNVFGSVVLPGDSKRSRFRRLRHGLVRRIEMAFYYENRPAWCDRWDFPLRALVTILVVVLIWGATFGVASAHMNVPRSFDRDEVFHVSFVFASVTLFFWMLNVGQTRLWTLFREKVGGAEFSRGALLNLSFLVLYAGLFIADAVSFHVLEEARAAGTIAPRPDDVFEAYREERNAYVGVCAILFLNIYLLSRVLAWIFLNAGTWRIWVFFATNVLLWGPIALYEITRQTAQVFPPWFQNFVYLSPYAVIEVRDVLGVDLPLRDRFASCLLAHACLTAVLAAMGFGLWCWLRRGARWPSMPSRQTRPAGRFGASVLLLVGPALLWSPASKPARAQEGVAVLDGAVRAWSVEGDLPVEVVEISRGFDGRTFSATADFLTVVFENRGAETVAGRLRVRPAWSGDASPWQAFELPPRTRVPVRLSFTLQGYWGSSELLLELESASRRLVVHSIGPAINVAQTAPGPRIEEGGRFLIVGDAPAPPVDWQRGTTGGAVVHIQCRPLSLPEDWMSYAQTSAVLVGSPDFSRWTLRQQQALYDYVRLGGSLVLFGDVDVESLRAAALWGRWFEGARERRFDAAGGRFGLVEFTGGGETLLYLESGAGGPVPLMSVRSVGAGRVGHLAFDPTSPNLPGAVRSSTQFWAEFTRRLPKSLHPVVLAPSHVGDRHLNDSGTLFLIIGYFALYTALLGPGLFLWFRQKERRRYMWGYALALCAVFAAGVFALDWLVHMRPSRGEIREMILFGPDSSEGVSYATVRVRSCGRQRHVLRAEGSRVSAFNLRPDFRWGTSFVPSEWVQPPVPDGAARELRLQLAPWSGRSLSLVSEVRLRSGVGGRATYDRSTSRLHFTIESDVEPLDGQYLLVTHNLDGRGMLRSHVLGVRGRGRFQATVSSSDGDGELRGGPSGAPGEVTASTRVFRRDWRSVVRVSGGSSPRVMVAWAPSELQAGVGLSSGDVLFRQEGTVDPQGRSYVEFREFRRLDDENGPYHLLHQQLIVQEIALEVR